MKEVELILESLRLHTAALNNEECKDSVRHYIIPRGVKDFLVVGGSLDIIPKIIEEIKLNVPLARRDDGSPDAVSTCRAIKEYSEDLWYKLVTYSLIPRSAWGVKKIPLTKNAAYASFTPIVLAAYKHEAQFSEWNTVENFDTPVAIYICLGTVLANMMYAKPLDTNIFTENFIKLYAYNGTSKPKYRGEDAFIDSSSNQGVSYYRPNLQANKTAIKDYINMLTQTWICHPSIRNPDTMILDLYDWDFVPEAVEEPKPKGFVLPDDWNDI